MTLSPPVRAAVLEVVRHLRDPTRLVSLEGIGYEIWAHTHDPDRNTIVTVLTELRDTLSAESVTLWARGKSREEVAAALERVATSAPPVR